MLERTNLAPNGVTVITCTKRSHALNNILDNFKRQLYNKKELIIILHDKNIDKNVWQKAIEGYGNIRLLQLDDLITLGECLNYGAAYASHEIIAKFDDDDYYGEKYLQNAVKTFRLVDAEVIGKATSYVYFERERILALRNLGHENRFVSHVDGPSIVFRRSVLKKVQFRDITRGEDKWFCHDCVEQGVKIYSLDRYHHIYMRHSDVMDHTWSIENEKLLKWCSVVSTGEINYKRYIDR